MFFKVANSLACLSLLVLIGSAVGCGGNSKLGKVTGTVQMDGAPLAGAKITFYPMAGGGFESGGASHGVTDEQGKYELRYSRQDMGAEIGMHKVVITTAEDGGGGDYGGGQKETVPKKYNEATELTADVKSGRNVFDFMDLDSSGDVSKGRGY